jgi:hypothetical protein
MQRYQECTWRLSSAMASSAVYLVSLFLLPAMQHTAIAQNAGMAADGSLSVTSGRPLADMVNKVQQLYVLPIDFEEAPYESPLDLKTVRVVQPDRSTKTFLALPITGFNVTLAQPLPSLYAAIQSVLSSYTSANLPGVYTIVQAGDRLGVIPQQVRAARGGMSNVTPVMGAPVEFSMAPRTVADTLQLVAQSISSATGAKVVVLNTPFHLTDMVTMNATGQPAREVIASMGNILGVPMSSQCLFDATEKTYYLNVQSIFAPDPAGVQYVPGRRAPVPSVGSANPELFTKEK